MIYTHISYVDSESPAHHKQPNGISFPAESPHHKDSLDALTADSPDKHSTLIRSGNSIRKLAIDTPNGTARSTGTGNGTDRHGYLDRQASSSILSHAGANTLTSSSPSRHTTEKDKGT